jgi:hypothetical protein
MTCRRADDASLSAPNQNHTNAKANQFFYHTLPCRATFLADYPRKKSSPANSRSADPPLAAAGHSLPGTNPVICENCAGAVPISRFSWT